MHIHEFEASEGEPKIHVYWFGSWVQIPTVFLQNWWPPLGVSKEWLTWNAQRCTESKNMPLVSYWRLMALLKIMVMREEKTCHESALMMPELSYNLMTGLHPSLNTLFFERQQWNRTSTQFMAINGNVNVIFGNIATSPTTQPLASSSFSVFQSFWSRSYHHSNPTKTVEPEKQCTLFSYLLDKYLLLNHFHVSPVSVSSLSWISHQRCSIGHDWSVNVRHWW